LEGCLALLSFKAAGCWAGKMFDYSGLKGCFLPGWRAVWFLPGLKADSVLGWRAIWFPLGLKADWITLFAAGA